MYVCVSIYVIESLCSCAVKRSSDSLVSNFGRYVNSRFYFKIITASSATPTTPNCGGFKPFQHKCFTYLPYAINSTRVECDLLYEYILPKMFLNLKNYIRVIYLFLNIFLYIKTFIKKKYYYFNKQRCRMWKSAWKTFSSVRERSRSRLLGWHQKCKFYF